MPTTYEFVVEELDWYEGCGDDPDIIDCPAFETVEAAISYARQCEGSWRIALRRDTGDEAQGLVGRFYAYAKNGRLQKVMETASGAGDGPDTPKKYLNLVIPECRMPSNGLLT